LTPILFISISIANTEKICNLSGGKEEFIKPFSDKIKFHNVNLLTDKTEEFFDVDEVWHLAADPSVKNSTVKTFFEELKITRNILEACVKNNVKRILFTSSSTVYGEAVPNTPENYETKPISFYGASKLSCESLISAYCFLYKIQGFIFRLANIIGKNSTHGVIYDFIHKILKNNKNLEILGDGTQTKSYLHIDDCIEAMITARDNAKDLINIFNVGSKDWNNVKEIADIVVEEMINANLINVKPEYHFTGGEEGRGWKGDVKKMLLSGRKLEKIGFKPKLSSNNAIRETAKEIIKKL
jgi:UDP-glucose 4-epimerase